MILTTVVLSAAADTQSLRSAITAAARKRDAAALAHLAPKVATSSAVVRLEYAAAYYYIAPVHNEQRFVSAFPTRGADVMGLIDILKGVPNVGSWYAYDTLSALARRGDRAALRKTMLAAAVADGGPAELLGSAIAESAKKRPSQVLMELATLPPAARDDVSKNSYIWCEAGSITVKRTKVSNDPQRAALRNIIAAAKTCRN